MNHLTRFTLHVNRTNAALTAQHRPEGANAVWLDITNGFDQETRVVMDYKQARAAALALLAAAQRAEDALMAEAANDGFIDNYDPEIDAPGADDYLDEVAR